MNDGERTLPQNQEAETHVLSACLRDAGRTLERAVEAGLTPDAFFSPPNRLIFSLLLGEREAKRPIGYDGLLLRIEETGQLEDAGGVANLMKLQDAAPTTAFARQMIDVVREKALRRQMIAEGSLLVEKCYNGVEIDDLAEAAEKLLRPVVARAGAPKKAELLRKLDERRVSIAAPVPEPVTRLFLAGKPISTPGNITTLISRAKTGKTAAIGGAIAAIVAAASGPHDYDTLKFTASNPEGKALILIDTEQSPFDANKCYERALKRVTRDDCSPLDHPWVYPYALVGLGPKELQQSLELACEEAAKKHKGIFAILLDGVADFVASVNDEAESNGVVNWIRAISVKYDCPAICVIHSNEGVQSGDDGRGHIGKQLIRKAESNLLLKKTGDVTSITSDKQRKAPITVADGVAFKWSEQEQRHVSCGAILPSATIEKIERLGEGAKEVFEALGKSGVKYSEFIKKLQEIQRISESRAGIKFTEMKHFGIIEKDIVNLWCLKKD